MTYIKQIVEAVNDVTAECGPVLLFGENIDTGSRIAGLARGLTVNSKGRILNVGNCELTHCGVGFGVMLDRGNAVLFMKQLDFLLLGLDQIVNTFNFIRAYRTLDDLGSFTIFLIVCDQGHQGPQSSMNSMGDVASIANVDIFCLNAASDAKKVISETFVCPGFRIVSVSQRLFGESPLEMPIKWQAPDLSIFQYRSGNDVTVACYNFALRSGVAVADHLAKLGMQSDLFHANFLPGSNVTALRGIVRPDRQTDYHRQFKDGDQIWRCSLGGFVHAQYRYSGFAATATRLPRFGLRCCGRPACRRSRYGFQICP